MIETCNVKTCLNAFVIVKQLPAYPSFYMTPTWEVDSISFEDSKYSLKSKSCKKKEGWAGDKYLKACFGVTRLSLSQDTTQGQQA